MSHSVASRPVEITANKGRYTAINQAQLMLKELKSFGTAAQSDAPGKAGAMDHEIKCRSANPRMAGHVFVV